jgi:hypothetical protein
MAVRLATAADAWKVIRQVEQVGLFHVFTQGVLPIAVFATGVRQTGTEEAAS